MATIRKRNGRWQAQVHKSGTRATSRTFTLRQDALFWAREQERVLELQTDVLTQHLVEAAFRQKQAMTYTGPLVDVRW